MFVLLLDKKRNPLTYPQKKTKKTQLELYSTNNALYLLLTHESDINLLS